jgi:flagellar hook protein FlgE
MLRSMFAGVSGLRGHQAMMDVIGNNIANVNTSGYKASQAVFQDLLSQVLRGAGAAQNGVGGTNPAQVGLGVRLGSIITSFTQGASQLTGRTTDLSILGDGFFVVRQGGQSLYTRLGAFSFDADGSLVTPDGGIVQGWLAQNGAINTNAPIADLQIPLGQTMPPVQTSSLKLGGNLPADVAGGTSITTSITVYDANGKAIPLTFNFIKDAARDVADGATTIASTTLTSATASFTPDDVGRTVTGAGIPPGTTIASYTNATTVVLSNPAAATASGVAVTFGALAGTWAVGATAPDTAGVSQAIPGFPQRLTFNPMTGLPTTGLTSITLNAGLNTLLGTDFAPGSLAIDLGAAGSPDGLLQFAGSNSVAALSQDGASIGFLRSFSIADNGMVTGVFSNGRTQAIAQVSLASFNNPAGLEKAGGSTYRQTVNSGLPQVGVPGGGGRGTLSGGTLEMSNVDLAQEFTNLIVAQRGFQANSRVITASDELLQDLVNLKR